MFRWLVSLLNDPYIYIFALSPKMLECKEFRDLSQCRYALVGGNACFNAHDVEAKGHEEGRKVDEGAFASDHVY